MGLLQRFLLNAILHWKMLTDQLATIIMKFRFLKGFKMRKAITISIFIASALGGAWAQTGSISIQLSSVKEVPHFGCNLNWIIINTTGLNITNIEYETTLREADNSVINRMLFFPGRLKSGVEVDYQSNAMGVKCSQIKFIKFNEVPVLMVDGRPIIREAKDKVSDSTILSSKMNGIKITR